MMEIFLLWNDQPANRIVKFVVEYEFDGDLLKVFDVCPVEVSLLDLQSPTVASKMKVRSANLYDLLRGRFLTSDNLAQLIARIAGRHQLSIVA